MTGDGTHNANGWGSDGRCWKCGQEWPCDGTRPDDTGVLSEDRPYEPGVLRISTAPWTHEQVDALRRRQADPMFHPYTCEEHSAYPLEPTIYGWECSLPGCRYEQSWAHAADVSHNVDTPPPQRLTDETGGNMTPGKLPPSQQDLDAIRERHVKHDDWYCEAGERIPDGQDQCDTRVVLDALELAEFDRDLYDSQADTARADADRLYRALLVVPNHANPRIPDGEPFGYPVGGHKEYTCPACIALDRYEERMRLGMHGEADAEIRRLHEEATR